MNFRPTQVKWQLMVASCYRRSGMNLISLIHLISLAISCHLSAFRVMIYVLHLFSGNYQKALETYKDIHRKFPENVECIVLNTTAVFAPLIICTYLVALHLLPFIIFRTGLRFLVRLCTDMGLKEVQDYATKLKKVEKMKEIREQVH